MKVKNFAPGPSKIPKDILDEISQDVLDFRNLGQSVLELSHRGEVFENIINESKKKLHKLLNIPNNFEIIFLQGGATFQNTFIAQNKPTLKDDILFLLSGTWGKKTHHDFQINFNRDIPSIALTNQSYEKITDEVGQSNKKYLYITSNETIQGIQIKKFNNFKDKKLIIDMSSDICSYQFEWDNISYIYAGAQKNLGIPGVTICIFDKDFIQKEDLTSYMNINNHIDKNSIFNTPPTFSIYVMLKVLEWIEKNGGLKEFERNNIDRANKIYNFLDNNLDDLTPLAPKEFRSTSNIVFDFKDKKQTEIFLEKSYENKFLGLNGHRSVGGIRVSNYNSITDEMISDFLIFLEKFISCN